MHALHFIRRQHGGLVALVARDLVGNAQLLQEPQDTLARELFRWWTRIISSLRPKQVALRIRVTLSGQVSQRTLQAAAKATVFDGAGQRNRTEENLWIKVILP